MISNPALGLWRRIRRRIAGTGLSLDTVADAQAQLTAIEADLPAYLWAYREVLGPWLAEAAAAGDLADQLVRWLHRHNQFLYATAQTRAELAQVYAQAMADTAELLAEARALAEIEAGLPHLFAEHHQRLALALKVAFGARLRDRRNIRRACNWPCWGCTGWRPRCWTSAAAPPAPWWPTCAPPGSRPWAWTATPRRPAR